MQEIMKQFVFWAQQAATHNLVQCSSGNLSQRLDDTQILVSATGSWLSSLSTDQVSIVSLATGESLNGIRPTGELPLHLGIMQERPDINAVLHFQSVAATSLCCATYVPDYNVIIEVPLYIGKVATLPYLKPGSTELAQAVRQLPQDIRMVQMSNHGQIAMGSSLEEVVQMAVFFELACQIILNNANKVNVLLEKDILGLNAYAKQRKR